MRKEYKLKESPSGAFFVMLGNTPIGGFHKREYAELFKSVLDGDAFYFDGETKQQIFNYFSNNHDFSLLESDFHELQIIISKYNYGKTILDSKIF